MKSWLFILVGPLLWALHFAGIYAIASVSQQLAGGPTSVARLMMVGASAVLLVATGLCMFSAMQARGGDAFDRFARSLSVSGSALAAVAMLWQTLPVLLAA